MSGALICPKCNARYPGGLTECPKDRSPLADARIADAFVGRALGNFQVERLLGAGGMGMVFTARHKVMGTEAVVKILSPDMTRLKDSKARFLNEAKLASAVHHPNIVRIFDFGETEPDGLVYMIMEYVPGEDLDSILKQEKHFDSLRAARIMRQVSSALEAAHSAPTGPVIHRDLKPANIRISRRGTEEHATVLDFGIAKASVEAGHERLTVQGMVVGTPRYMAPEQACGDAVDARTDVYALGVIAYELAKGHTPYQTSRLVELVAHQLHSPVPPLKPEEALKGYSDVVMRCLKLEPQDRFQTAGDLRDALDEFIASEAAKNLKRLIKVGGVVFALCAIVAAWIIFTRPPGGSFSLNISKLEIDGKDVSSSPRIFVRAKEVRLAGVIDGLEAVPPEEKPVVVVGFGKKSPKVETRGNTFSARLPLAEDESEPLRISVVTTRKLVRHTQPVGNERTVVRDTKPPALKLEEEPAGGVFLFRDARPPEIVVDIDEKWALAGVTATARGSRARAQARIAGGAARVALDLRDLAPNALAIVIVSAWDEAGNESPALALPVRYDPDPPALALVSVRGAARAMSGEYLFDEAPHSVEVSAVAKDPSGIESMDLTIDGRGEKTDVTHTADWTQATFTAQLDVEGDYRLILSAKDRAGNTTETAIALRCAIPLQVDPLSVAAAVNTTVTSISGHANKALKGVVIEREVGSVREPAGEATIVGAEFQCKRVLLAPRAKQVLWVTVTPERGEPVTRSAPIISDDEPPTVAITKPSPWPDLVTNAMLKNGVLECRVTASAALSGLDALSPRGVKFIFETEEEGRTAAGTIEREGIDVPIAGKSTLQMRDGDFRIGTDAKFIVIAVEAKDRAGNRRTIVRRTKVEVAPKLTASPEALKIGLHEPIKITITSDKPLKEEKVLVNGKHGNVKKASELVYVYTSTMYLDSPTTYTVSAEDGAGSKAEPPPPIQIERELVCRFGSEKDENGQPLTKKFEKSNLDAVKPIKEKYGNADCPFCKKYRLYSGEKGN